MEAFLAKDMCASKSTIEAVKSSWNILPDSEEYLLHHFDALGAN